MEISNQERDSLKNSNEHSVIKGKGMGRGGIGEEKERERRGGG